MGTSYRHCAPVQPGLLPPSPRDRLPESRPACFISGTLEQLDLGGLHLRYQGDRRRNQPCHPEMKLKLLVCACATGVFSSPKIARKIDEDIAFRVLAAGGPALESAAGRTPSPHFSPRGEAKCVRGPSVRGARRLTSTGVLARFSHQMAKRSA